MADDGRHAGGPAHLANAGAARDGGGDRDRLGRRDARNAGGRRRARAGLGGDDLLAEFVDEHRHPLPPEAHNAGEVRGLEQYVGVPVSPANFERAGAHLVGGRIFTLLPSQRAAMIQYVVGSGNGERRVSVLVYDAQKIPAVGIANLAPRAIGTAEVRVGREKGYSVAATQRAGVGYLIASDLDPDQSAQFAATISTIAEASRAVAHPLCSAARCASST